MFTTTSAGEETHHDGDINKVRELDESTRAPARETAPIDEYIILIYDAVNRDAG